MTIEVVDVILKALRLHHFILDTYCYYCYVCWSSSYSWLLRSEYVELYIVVQLMGRAVDLHYLVSQRINSTLLRSLDVAISRFEALGFTSVVVSTSVRCHVCFKPLTMQSSFSLSAHPNGPHYGVDILWCFPFHYLSVLSSILYRLSTCKQKVVDRRPKLVWTFSSDQFSVQKINGEG